MDVAVDEPPGLVFVQQAVEALKAPVGQVLAVVQATGGGVGQQQVDAAGLVGLVPELGGPYTHGKLCILVGVLPVIAYAAAQTHNAQAVEHINVIVNAGAAAGLVALVAAVVVAVHIQGAAVKLGRCSR